MSSRVQRAERQLDELRRQVARRGGDDEDLAILRQQIEVRAPLFLLLFFFMYDNFEVYVKWFCERTRVRRPL
jgi:hypothetical protein